VGLAASLHDKIASIHPPSPSSPSYSPAAVGVVSGLSCTGISTGATEAAAPPTTNSKRVFSPPRSLATPAHAV